MIGGCEYMHFYETGPDGSARSSSMLQVVFTEGQMSEKWSLKQKLLFELGTLACGAVLSYAVVLIFKMMRS
jgi:hypothetical protein